MTSYTNSARNGIEKRYYKSGKIQAEIPYTDGKMNGIGKGYAEDGKLLYEITYADNKKVALKQYDSNGNEIK